MKQSLQNGTPYNIEDFVAVMFQTRAQGDRLLFRQMFGIVYDTHPDLAARLLEYVPQYGYWKDFFYLATTHCSLMRPALFIAYDQLLADENLLDGISPSLFSKWMPREGKLMGRFSKEFANHIYFSTDLSHSQRMASLRRRISRLNAAIKTVEVYMCANRWNEIRPQQVPRVAGNKMRAAFLNESTRAPGVIRAPNDAKRMACREAFLATPPRETPIRLKDHDSLRAVVREFLRGQDLHNTQPV